MLKTFVFGLLVGAASVSGLFVTSHVEKIEGAATIQCVYSNCIQINDTTFLVK